MTLPWAEVVKDEMVREAIDALRREEAGFLSAFYTPVNEQTIRDLSDQVINRVPPVRKQSYSEKTVPLVPSDFRDIILAGWLSWARTLKSNVEDPLTFLQINRLCEHAILQDLAIGRQGAHLKNDTGA